MRDTRLIHDLNLRMVRLEDERDNLLQELERLARENGRLKAIVEAAQVKALRGWVGSGTGDIIFRRNGKRNTEHQTKHLAAGVD